MPSYPEIDNGGSRVLANIPTTIRTWTRGDKRAPHKPLLLLLALARIARGAPRLVAFTEIEEPLRRLLQEFGPTRTSYHPEYPFWRLQADGLWEIPGGAALPSRMSNTDPPITALRVASGGLPVELDRELRSNRAALDQLARAILDEHFPTSVHDSILSAVGLELDAGAAPRRPRDPRFRDLVLRAYGYCCAVCGFDARLDGVTISIDAAHVRWHASGGPDEVDNALALCPLHHKAFDLGLFTVAIDGTITVSSRLHGGDAVERHLGDFHGCQVRPPLHGHAPVAAHQLTWHHTEVFKSPARP